MTDSAFLRAILDHPLDDGPRLVYADWLEERGDWLGGFIRCQIEGGRYAGPRVPVVRRVLGRELCGMLEFLNDAGGVTRNLVVSGWRGRRWMVRSLEGNAYEEGADGWADFRRPLPRTRFYIERGFLAEAHLSVEDWLGRPCFSCHGYEIYARGTHLCPARHGKGRFPGHAGTIMATTPIRRVRFTTRPDYREMVWLAEQTGLDWRPEWPDAEWVRHFAVQYPGITFEMPAPTEFPA